MNLKEKSYLYGLFITDGNLYMQSRNRGKISIELSEKDLELLEKIYKVAPEGTISKRKRDTNFKKNYTSVCYKNYQQNFRNIFIEMGFPIEDKTNNANTPQQEYSERDFWRGVIDGDGSLGFTKDGIPFLSLVTKSENLKVAYCSYLQKELGIEKNIKRNKRDAVYNITIKNEEAVQLAKILYNRNDTLFLNRKMEKKEEIEKWVRTTKRHCRKMWKEEEDEYVLTHSIQESMEHLKRTESSIKNRVRRLKSKNSNK